MLSAHDTGTVINPVTYQGQVEGGMMQGLGFALMENLRDDEGKIITPSLGEYRIRAPPMCRHLKLCCSRIKTAPDPFIANR